MMLSEIAFHSRTRGQPSLRAGEVHLWQAELRPVDSAMRALLSADEWLRESKFHFASDAERYVATRALVRQILGGYLDEDPATLRFVKNQYGKPALETDETLLRFNISHSEGILLLAIAYGREIGVDVEAVRANVHHEMLAEHYFTPEDQWALRITPVHQRTRKFFELWTRTEATVKAHGSGLIEPAVRPGSGGLTVRSFEPAAGFCAAIAVEGDEFDLACWKWQQ